MNLSNLNYLPKAPYPNTITLGVRASIHEFGGGGDTNIQSITVSNLSKVFITIKCQSLQSNLGLFYSKVCVEILKNGLEE